MNPASDNPSGVEAAVEGLSRPPLVKVVDGYFEFYVDGVMVYDFSPSDAGAALRWIEHMARKGWVTKEHIFQFSKLAADSFGVRYV